MVLPRKLEFWRHTRALLCVPGASVSMTLRTNLRARIFDNATPPDIAAELQLWYDVCRVNLEKYSVRCALRTRGHKSCVLLSI